MDDESKTTLEEGWQHFREHVRHWWSALTDDEIELIAGDRDRLATTLRARYGWTQESVDAEIDRFLTGVRAFR